MAEILGLIKIPLLFFGYRLTYLSDFLHIAVSDNFKAKSSNQRSEENRQRIEVIT